MQRWSEVLKPWRVHFQQMPGVLSSESVVHVDLGVDSTRRSWRKNVLRCREALELLAIIAIVENVSEMAPPPERLREMQQHPHTCYMAFERDRAPRRYIIHCYNRECIRDIDDVKVYKAFFFAFDASTLRDEFRHALDAIYSQLTPDMKHKVEKNWRLPVWFFFSVTRHGPDISVAYLKSVMELVKGIEERSIQAAVPATATPEDNGSWGYRFPYTDTIARLNIDLCKLEQGAAPILTELLALGIQFDGKISFSSSSALGRLPISELGPVLQAITDAPSIRAFKGFQQILRSDWEELSLQDWRLDGEWHARLLKAVCSSLAVCKAFNKLQLSRLGDGASRKSSRKILQWLAYALFSKEAKTSITSLTISYSDLQEEEMAAILDVLAARNPVKVLLDAQEGNTDDDEDPGFASLKADTTITIKPIEDESQLGANPESVVLKQDGVFRVMKNDRKFDCVDIIVPHYGHCIVTRASIDHFMPAASNELSQSAGYGGSITSLKVEECGHQALLPLIEFIGPKLLSVKILVKYDGIIKIDYLRQLVSACPNLKKLELGETEKEVLTVFVEAYASGRCKIEHLSFYNFLTGRGDCFIPFIRMLQDPTSAVAKSLRFLKIPSAGHDLYKGNVFKALAEMLQVNRTIEYLEIDMYESLFRKHKAAMMRTNGLRIRRPLNLASRYAFLSVVQHYATSSESAEPPRKRLCVIGHTEAYHADHGRLNRAVISSIFVFAEESATRHIHIDPFYEGQTPPER